MNFKDRKYYIAKIKYYLGLAVTALMFDALLLWLICG